MKDIFKYHLVKFIFLQAHNPIPDPLILCPNRQRDIQWNLGIRDTHGTVKNCPEFGGGRTSHVHLYVMNRPRDWRQCP